MPGNPLIPQGTLSRLRASVVWNDFPSLNVTPPYLGKEAIRFSLEGESTLFIPTMTGAVTSQEPYMMINLVLHLLKTQSLSDAYKRQMEQNAQLGNGTVRPDSITLSPFQIVNCAIESVRELAFSGDDAGFAVTVKGFYNINSQMWDL